MMVKIGILKQISARGKIESVQDHIDEIVDSGEKVVVFCSLREIGDRLKEIYPKALMIRGGMSDEEKQHSITSFQNKPESNIIICSIKAAGVGITLTASSRVVFVEFPMDVCRL
jgi:SWI/SNF-related matrix-associated actin-dependent regulator 1 of chromatin subfamily A